jgi:8-oxo-dGTP diphosphatase
MRAKEVFKDKVRLRVNGILQHDDAVLLVRLQSPVTDELVWMPPGGGVEFGESMTDALKREFCEETGLQVRVATLAFVNELIEPPFHAVEFYFNVHRAAGDLLELLLGSGLP